MSTVIKKHIIKNKKQTDLGVHFSKFDLVKYSAPTMLMLLCVSVYWIVDGLFVSNFVGSTAFAAVNLFWPIFDILGAFGIMIGAGSSAFIANKLGEKDSDTANQYLTIFFILALVLSFALAIICLIVLEPLLILMGAEGEVLNIALYYGSVSMVYLPGFIIQMASTAWFNTAGKPNVGFLCSILSGIVICVVDFILVGILGWGIDGTLVANICCEYVSAIFAFVYFFNKNNKSLIHFKFSRNVFKVKNISLIRLCLKACVNGSGEAIQQIAMSLVLMLCYFQLNIYSGESGIVAYGVIEYAWILFNSFYIGYALAVAPIMSYQQGAKNIREMKILFKNSITVIVILSIICFIVPFALSYQVAELFVGYDQDLTNLTFHAFRIFSFTYLFCGISIYGSNFFMSIGRGLVGAIIALSRSLVFETSGLIILPLILGLDGIWIASVGAEIFTTMVTTILFYVYRNKFLY